MIELVLPSGRFASIRPITWMDRAQSFDPGEPIDFWLMRLATRCVLIDGEALKMEEFARMELTEANPIINALTDMVSAAFKSRGVA